MMGVGLRGSVFNHIPKTGGGWVNRSLLNGIEYADHKPGDEHIRRIVTGKIHFCFVRNPISWYMSRWRCPFHNGRYRKLLGPPDHINYVEDAINEEEIICFNTWLERVLYMSPGPRYMPTKDYGECGFATKQFMHFVETSQFVGKQETLKKDLLTVLDMAKETYDIDAILNTPPQHVPTVHKQLYDPHLLDEVYRLDKKIFDDFGYDKLTKGFLPIKLI